MPFPRALTMWVPLLCSLLLACDLGAPNPEPTAIAGQPVDAAEVQIWLTTPDASRRLSSEPARPYLSGDAASSLTVRVDEQRRFQTIAGFGASITESSAEAIFRLSSAQRDALMRDLFDPVSGLGVSFLRQPMGASDLSTGWWTYHDVSGDPDLSRFNIDRDRAKVIPLLHQARALNPELQLMLTPWTAPGWMKVGYGLSGGTLIDPVAYRPLARYLIKSVQAYEAAGLPVHAFTVQNEPLHTSDYPSMKLEWWQASNLVRYHLAAELKAAKLDARLLLFDHNWSDADYPRQMLDHPETRDAAAGTAFHCYGGDPAAMGALKAARPDHDLYLTECSSGTWSGAWADDLRWQMTTLFIGSLRNHARTVVKWALVLDEQHGPQLPGSTGACKGCRGLATVDSSGGFTRTLDAVTVGHFSKFVRVGAQRIDSDDAAGQLPNVAFLNPDGSKVMVAFNPGTRAEQVKVLAGARSFVVELPPGSAATWVWR
jgi:glucosylceramidase